jgi:exopolyphosphatase/guanosine-5'-triphosphate,3'-diphosphate pyrophosphatase
MRVATLDIGTNSILLLVYDAATGRAVEERARVERLGQGVDRTGRLDPAAIARALDALREYAAVIAAHGAERVAAVGTQALREVPNGADFLEPAREILGVAVEVIGGEREAELAARAVLASFPELARGETVIVDIGGGSTELIVASGGAVRSMVSVKLGSVRMTERHLAHDPPTADEARAMLADIDATLAGVELPAGATYVGVAGTVTTLASVALGLERYDGERVHGLRLARAEIVRQLEAYLGTSVAARRAMPGMHPQRADVIPGGCAIVAQVLARAGADSLLVSDRGIRWGLAEELSRDKVRSQ